MKKCTRCGRLLPLSQFHRDKISEEIKSNPRIKVTVADIRNMILNR